MCNENLLNILNEISLKEIEEFVDDRIRYCFINSDGSSLNNKVYLADDGDFYISGITDINTHTIGELDGDMVYVCTIPSSDEPTFEISQFIEYLNKKQYDSFLSNLNEDYETDFDNIDDFVYSDECCLDEEELKDLLIENFSDIHDGVCEQDIELQWDNARDIIINDILSNIENSIKVIEHEKSLG